MLYWLVVKKKTQQSPAPVSAVPGMTFTPPMPVQQAVTAPPLPQQPMTQMSEIAEKLDAILAVMKRHERRERLRSMGRMLHAVIWFSLVIGSSWYLYEYGPELMQSIAQSAAESAAKVAEQNSQQFMEQMQQQVSPDLLKLLGN